MFLVALRNCDEKMVVSMEKSPLGCFTTVKLLGFGVVGLRCQSTFGTNLQV